MHQVPSTNTELTKRSTADTLDIERQQNNGDARHETYLCLRRFAGYLWQHKTKVAGGGATFLLLVVGLYGAFCEAVQNG